MTNQPTCSVPDCTVPVKARKLCGRHLQRAYRHGSPLILLIGQDPASPAPCLICGGPIETESRRIAPRLCSNTCRSRQRRQRMSALRERVLAGLAL